MKTLLILVPCLLLATGAAHATDPAARAARAKAAADAAAAAAAPAPHKSVFMATASDHNPFWPIGWVKTEAASANADAPPPMMPHAEDFTVTTILLNSPPMAVINGKEMEEGEIVAFPIGGQQVTVQLMAVQDGRVILRWQNQNIVVALHRDENLTGIYNGQPATAALR
jgi:hypothetical protein